MTPYVFDDVLPDPVAYRAAVLAQPRRSHELAPEVVFHGIAPAPDRSLADWIEAHFPQLAATMSVTRLSPLGQIEPNAIHTDCDLGEWTGILYLNPDPPEGDGTTFYRDRATGAEVSTAATLDQKLDEGFAWREAELWEPTQTVAAQFGRLVLFPSAAFHSRAIFENYGTGTDARLVQIVFGTGVLT
jgi:Family of unknown function (DUF6445)